MGEDFDPASFMRKVLLASPDTVQRLREKLPGARLGADGATRVYDDMGGSLATIREVPGIESGKVYEFNEPDPLSFVPMLDLPPLPPPEMFWAPVRTFTPLRIPLITSLPDFDWAPAPRRLGKADQRRVRVRESLKRRREVRRLSVSLRKATGPRAKTVSPAERSRARERVLGFLRDVDRMLDRVDASEVTP